MKRKRGMKVPTAVEVLEALGCSEDPIVWQGVETTPGDLEGTISLHYHGEQGHVRAADLRITYSGGRGTRRGTLSGMVKDRLALSLAEDY